MSREIPSEGQTSLPWHRAVDRVLFALIAAALLLFLSACLWEKGITSVLISGSVLAALSLAHGFYHVHEKIPIKPLNLLASSLIIAAAVIGAVATSLLNLRAHWGPVLAAAAVGTAAGYGLPLFSHSRSHDLAAAAYCGAFVGMTAPARFGDPLLIALAGGIAGFIFVLSQNPFSGCGGKLGTIAFIGTAAVMVLLRTLHV